MQEQTHKDAQHTCRVEVLNRTIGVIEAMRALPAKEMLSVASTARALIHAVVEDASRARLLEIRPGITQINWTHDYEHGDSGETWPVLQDGEFVVSFVNADGANNQVSLLDFHSDPEAYEHDDDFVAWRDQDGDECESYIAVRLSIDRSHVEEFVAIATALIFEDLETEAIPFGVLSSSDSLTN